jgi:hypothetical protein
MVDFRVRLSDGTTVYTDDAGHAAIIQAIGLIEGRRLAMIRVRDEKNHAPYDLAVNVDQVVWIRGAV